MRQSAMIEKPSIPGALSAPSNILVAASIIFINTFSFVMVRLSLVSRLVSLS